MQAFKNDSVDTDFCGSQIQEIFSMSTKWLEQIGRAVAFHHTMTGTALYSLSDQDKFYDLPLSSEGVFGPGFATLLKDREEQKKLVGNWLDIPDLKKNSKRKFSSNDRHSSIKEQYVPTATVSSARASSSVTREPSEPLVDDFQIQKRDFLGTSQVKDRGRLSHQVEEQMVSQDVPQIEDRWRVQLSNYKVRIITKFPEIPVKGRLSLHERLEENYKRQMGIRNYSEGLQVRISDENGIQGDQTHSCHTRSK